MGNNGWVEKEFSSANCGAVLLSMTKSQYGTCHGIYDLQYQAKSLSWMVAPRGCQTCDEVCAEHGQVCDASHLGPILTEGEVTRNAEKAGFKCTNFYRETWAWTEWDGPLLGMRPGMCVYNGNPSWKPSCSRRPACGYGHRLCPCEDRNFAEVLVHAALTQRDGSFLPLAEWHHTRGRRNQLGAHVGSSSRQLRLFDTSLLTSGFNLAEPTQFAVPSSHDHA